MARISTYSVDNTLQKSDKLLGSNLGGKTRNFTLEDITTYLASVGISGKMTFMFVDNKYNGSGSQQRGQITYPDGPQFSSLSFTAASKIRVSKFPFGEEKTSILQRLQNIKSQNVIISNINDVNNFGVFLVTDIVQYNSTDFYDVFLTHITSNGSLENLKYFSIDVYGSDKNHTHHQNNASDTWNINHNLGKFPAVTIKFSTGATYTNVGAFAGVVFTDENNLTINLAAAQSGYAYLN
jgi:hypothetical protein